MSSKYVPAPQARPHVAAALRAAIAKAEAEGVARPDMTLRLTLHDEADLRRDRSIPLTDIRFSDGVMHFLDVKIVAGDVQASTLETAPS